MVAMAKSPVMIQTAALTPVMTLYGTVMTVPQIITQVSLAAALRLIHTESKMSRMIAIHKMTY